MKRILLSVVLAAFAMPVHAAQMTIEERDDVYIIEYRGDASAKAEEPEHPASAAPEEPEEEPVHVQIPPPEPAPVDLPAAEPEVTEPAQE
jgi:hypothetical protein